MLSLVASKRKIEMLKREPLLIWLVQLMPSTTDVAGGTRARVQRTQEWALIQS